MKGGVLLNFRQVLSGILFNFSGGDMKNEFILSKRISGSPYFPSCIQGLAGKKVSPVEITFRALDAEKQLFVTLHNNGRNYQVPLRLFDKHPPEKKLRIKARKE